MLISLGIRNMLLVEKAEISFSTGLNVFTGETGAGKSIILDCLGFVLGKRSRNRFLRTSCDSGEVVAEFLVDECSEVRELVDELSILFKDTVVLRRVEFSDGRRKAYVNDTSCTLDTLQKIGSKLIEFVDQKDGSLTLKKSNHISLLDEFSGNKNTLSLLNVAWNNINRTQKEISVLTISQETLRQELEFVEQSLSELKSLKPRPGEIEDLEVMQTTLRSSNKIAENLQGAVDLISGGNARNALVSALNKLEKAAGLMPGNSLLSNTTSSLEGLIHELDDIEKNIPTILEDRSSNKMTLEDVEARLFNFRNIARKHGVSPNNLMVLHQELETSLLEYHDIEKKICDLRRELLSLKKTYKMHAEELSKKRKSEGKNLDRLMLQELIPLKMDGMKFKTLLEERKDCGPNGHDIVTFQIANHGMSPQDLERIASGGELSRLLLALKVCLVTNTKGVTLVFDEIDRGIGGATAAAVGHRLASLAEKDQVLLVTHSAQVASKANRHWRVKKVICKEDKPVTLLDELNEDSSTAELARMISGEVVSDEALAAAQKLMD